MKKYQNNYTLLEIMIVLGIVGILSAIAVPRFSQHRQDSFTKQMASNVRMVEMAKEQWKLDNPGGDGSVLELSDISPYMSHVDSEDDLVVNGVAITIGGIDEDPCYVCE